MPKSAFLAVLCCLPVFLSACADHSPGQNQPLPARRWMFLGLPDDQQRTIEQDNPNIDSRLRGIAIISKVELADYQEYQRQKQAGHISEEARHGDYIYYAIQTARDAGPAMVMVTARYKAVVAASPLRI
jgi:hypothetical protein